MSFTTGSIVRPAIAADAARLGVLAGELVTMHHAVDPRRFFLPDDVQKGYAWWLGREMTNTKAVVLVSETAGAIDGYAYGTVEARNWNALLDEHGAIHDVFVDAEGRRRGRGRALLGVLVESLERLGAGRIVLSTMVQNEAAQRLFASMGFRPTMLEMTRG